MLFIINMVCSNKFNKKIWLETDLHKILSTNSLIFFCHLNNVPNTSFFRYELTKNNFVFRIIKNSILCRLDKVGNATAIIYLKENSVSFSAYLDSIFFLRKVLGFECVLLAVKINFLLFGIEELEKMYRLFCKFNNLLIILFFVCILKLLIFEIILPLISLRNLFLNIWQR